MSIKGFDEGFVMVFDEGKADWAIPVMLASALIQGSFAFYAKLLADGSKDDRGIYTSILAALVDIGSVAANIRGSATQKTFAVGSIIHMIGLPMAITVAAKDDNPDVRDVSIFSSFYFIGELCEIVALLQSLQDNDVAFYVCLGLVAALGLLVLCPLCIVGYCSKRDGAESLFTNPKKPVVVAIICSDLILVIPVVALAIADGPRNLLLFLPEFPLEIIDMIGIL